MSRYYVVQFINSEDNTSYFDVIPKEWKINKDTCYWPKNWTTKQIRNAVKKRIAFDTDWSVNQIRKLAETYTFEEGDFIAGRELIRFNKRVKRFELEKIKKEIIDDGYEDKDDDGSDSSNSSDSSDSDSDSDDDSDDDSSNSDDSDESKNDYVSQQEPQPQLESLPRPPPEQRPSPFLEITTMITPTETTVTTETATISTNSSTAEKQSNEYPQISIPEGPIADIENPDIMAILSEQVPELSLEQMPDLILDKLLSTDNFLVNDISSVQQSESQIEQVNHSYLHEQHQQQYYYQQQQQQQALCNNQQIYFPNQSANTFPYNQSNNFDNYILNYGYNESPYLTFTHNNNSTGPMVQCDKNRTDVQFKQNNDNFLNMLSSNTQRYNYIPTTTSEKNEHYDDDCIILD